MRLRDKICVVTGGARGIGRAIVERFVAEGARVAILDVNGEEAMAAAAAMRNLGGDVYGYRCDVAERGVVVSTAESVKRDIGFCDVLVNNAGVVYVGPSVDFPEDHWRRSIDVMQGGVFFCSQEFGRQMIQRRRGAIVNVASMNAIMAFPMRLAYNAAKAAVVSMTQVLAIEWARYGIRVNAVGPGVTATEMQLDIFRNRAGNEAAYIDRIPLRRMAQPEEIANAVLYLASEEDSSYVTGVLHLVDGGWSAYGYVAEDGETAAEYGDRD